jgi:hypothetical protein
MYKENLAEELFIDFISYNFIFRVNYFIFKKCELFIDFLSYSLI